ncbi:hypothetical protein F4805DRAFT_413151 [Annulohypoxylon moriforme]|nr:hypothetical protein F4805DRAFT_413151 [Annulohypoxylon moriforme]
MLLLIEVFFLFGPEGVAAESSDKQLPDSRYAPVPCLGRPVVHRAVGPGVLSTVRDFVSLRFFGTFGEIAESFGLAWFLFYARPWALHSFGELSQGLVCQCVMCICVTRRLFFSGRLEPPFELSALDSLYQG